MQGHIGPLVRLFDVFLASKDFFSDIIYPRRSTYHVPFSQLYKRIRNNRKPGSIFFL